MEPFGLFDLLKTLLPPTVENPDKQTQNPVSPTQDPPVKTTEITAPPEEKNACWEFMTKHDERARNTKKKTP